MAVVEVLVMGGNSYLVMANVIIMEEVTEATQVEVEVAVVWNT